MEYCKILGMNDISSLIQNYCFCESTKIEPSIIQAILVSTEKLQTQEKLSKYTDFCQSKNLEFQLYVKKIKNAYEIPNFQYISSKTAYKISDFSNDFPIKNEVQWIENSIQLQKLTENLQKNNEKCLGIDLEYYNFEKVFLYQNLDKIKRI